MGPRPSAGATHASHSMTCFWIAALAALTVGCVMVSAGCVQAWCEAPETIITGSEAAGLARTPRPLQGSTSPFGNRIREPCGASAPYLEVELRFPELFRRLVYGRHKFHAVLVHEVAELHVAGDDVR